MDELLFFAYANSTRDELPSLSEEIDAVDEALSERALKKSHFVIHRDGNATIPKIVKKLIQF